MPTFPESPTPLNQTNIFIIVIGGVFAGASLVSAFSNPTNTIRDIAIAFGIIAATWLIMRTVNNSEY